MDWQTIITIAALVVFGFMMMRGCGGMMAGGCGHSPAPRGQSPRQAGEEKESGSTGSGIRN